MPASRETLLLTKALGVGLLCTANRGRGDLGTHGSRHSFHDNPEQDRCGDQPPVYCARGHRCDRFSFLGHLHEMMGGNFKINARAVPVLPGAEKAADDFLYTAAGQRNRNHTGLFVRFEGVPFGYGGSLVRPADLRRSAAGSGSGGGQRAEKEMQSAGLPG